MEYATIIVSDALLDKMKEWYHEYLLDNPGEYVAFMALFNDIKIIAYNSKNANAHKVTFSGDSVLGEARIWDDNATLTIAKEKIDYFWKDLGPQIGSDEVGTGDFFGPVIVVAAYVSAFDITKLYDLGIDDSKKLTDARIRELGPILIKNFTYSQLAVTSEKYNELLLKGYNMNKIKAVMHNAALYNLVKKKKHVFPIYVDQFVASKTYYQYLMGEKNIVTNITFSTKGESWYPSIALASVIARYSFLLKMDSLSQKYDMVFPFGASRKVDEFAMAFFNRYGIKELKKVAKNNFVNMEIFNREPLFKID